MSRDEFGPFVIDRHAFKPLWPALGVWLFLFLTAGDGVSLVGRQLALAFGAPAQATVADKSRRNRRNYLHLSYEWKKQRRSSRAPVGKGWGSVKPRSKRAVHLLAGKAYLDDDLGYSGWKLLFFSAAFVALWAWAFARRRFG